MNFEASTSLTPGTGITAKLITGENRVSVEIIGHPAPEYVGMAVPRVLQLLADKSRLPIRHEGRVFRPGPVHHLDSSTTWGTPEGRAGNIGDRLPGSTVDPVKLDQYAGTNPGGK